MTDTKDSSQGEPLDPFFRAAFSIDLALFTYHDDRLKVLLSRKQEPMFEGREGLPGMLIYPNQDTGEALAELAREAIGTDDLYRRQLRAFSSLGRHPQGRVVTIAYLGLIPFEDVELSDDSLFWSELEEVSDLSYDHDRILESAKQRFTSSLLNEPTVFEVLPDEFILRDVIRVYELAFSEALDYPNFRRQLRSSGLLLPTGEIRDQARKTGRPPEVYRFDRAAYHGASRQAIGFHLTAK
jgi:8-oxo-dGTP diphosphatase